MQTTDSDAASLIELLEGDIDTNPSNVTIPTTESNENDNEDEIIEINGDEVMGDDETVDQVVKVKLEEMDDDDEEGGSDDDEGEDDGAQLDDDDEEYDAGNDGKAKKKNQRPKKGIKKVKKPKEVLIPQMVSYIRPRSNFSQDIPNIFFKFQKNCGEICIKVLKIFS